MRDDIGPIERASPLARACLADRQQPGQPRPGGAIGRIEKQPRPVGQYDPASGDQPDAGGLLRIPCAHHAGDAPEIGDPERDMALQGSCGKEFLRRRGAAQEAVMAGNLEFDIAGHQPNTP